MLDYLKRFKFDKSQFRLGMRTFKTGVGVLLVLLVFGFFGLKGLQIGALTVVFSLREDFDQSVSFGASRIFANTVGGIFSLIFYGLNSYFGGDFWVTLVFVPILTMLTIMINVACNNKSGVIGGVSALLIITLSIPTHDTILYVFERIFETFIGVFIAIMVNSDTFWLKKAKK